MKEEIARGFSLIELIYADYFKVNFWKFSDNYQQTSVQICPIGVYPCAILTLDF